VEDVIKARLKLKALENVTALLNDLRRSGVNPDLKHGDPDFSPISESQASIEVVFNGSQFIALISVQGTSRNFIATYDVNTEGSGAKLRCVTLAVNGNSGDVSYSVPDDIAESHELVILPSLRLA